jgi:hypothetical protein
VLRGGGSRRWSVPLIAYYAVVVVIVGPMCFSQARAEPRAHVPVGISLRLAMRTKTTDIATFAMRAPLSIAVGADGTFTLPANALAFTPVDVPVATLGTLTVRAVAMSDFVGTVNTSTGTATLDGALELLWSKPTSTYRPSRPQMLDCPVGPFGAHLSTATVGGTPLSPESSLDPTSRTATLVDSTLDVGAVPAETTQCGGNERSLNQALSLPIVPTTTTTTSTTASTSTSTSVPVSSTTTTIAPTTTSSSTTTTVRPAASGTPITDGLGVALNPTVLAFEPTPFIVSTLTIATVPPPTSPTPAASTPTTADHSILATPSIPSAAPVHATDHQRRRPVKAVRQPRRKYHANRHAQTDATTTLTEPAATTSASAHVNAPPPLYFSPSYFDPSLRLTAHRLSHMPTPLANLGDPVAHRNVLSLLFIALLSLPLVVFGLGLIATDLGWQPHLRGRRRRPAPARRKPSLHP